MNIEKLSKSKYKITGLVRTNVLRDLLELFDIRSYHDKENEITIDNIDTFEKFYDWEKNQHHPQINYLSAEEMFDNFAAISLYLEKLGMQLSHIDPTKLVVINGNIFIPMNLEDLYIIKKNKITINNPYSKENPYLSLELKENSTIPYTVHFTCFYSSLALLIYDKLIGLENNADYHDGLKLIFGSRLYWILRYSLLENPEERLIVII
tara:strand:+ start:7044 stop:7667 length:624 start_codon:yes stop_codon:yes gene_type:complete